MSLLELDDVVATYGKVAALKGLSLRVDEGELVAMLGANVAGKSTTLRTISGLLKPQSGSIRFMGQSIVGLPPEAIVRRGIAHVPEGRRVFPGLTVRENILVGAHLRQLLLRLVGLLPDFQICQPSGFGLRRRFLPSFPPTKLRLCLFVRPDLRFLALNIGRVPPVTQDDDEQ